MGLKLRSWDAKKVRSVVICFSCNKPHCIFSNEINDACNDAAAELEKKMESLVGYTCGDLIFDDDHPVSQVIAQRKHLDCETKVETAYFNVEGRKFKTVPVCIYCGETGTKDFLYQQLQLELHNKTVGKKCYPICVDCLEDGKKVVYYSKSKTNEQQKRKESAAKKTAGANKRAKKT
jgi:hypothetical protein